MAADNRLVCHLVNINHSALEPPSRSTALDSGTSSVRMPYQYEIPKDINALRKTCKDSRNAFLDIYASFPLDKDGNSRILLNTWTDVFHLGGSTCKNFKLLGDIVLKNYLNQSVPSQVQQDLNSFRRIGPLLVDIDIFGQALPLIWPEFTRLETITIVFSPMSTVVDQLLDQTDRPVGCGQFVVPVRHTLFGKRAAWLARSAKAILDKSKKAVPAWHVPRVQVVARGLDSDIETEEEKIWHVPRYNWAAARDQDVEIEAEPILEEHEADKTQETDDADEYTEAYDDSQWYREAEELLSYEWTDDDLEYLKQQYLPDHADDSGIVT